MADPRFVLQPPLYVWAWRLSLALYAVSFVLPVGAYYWPTALGCNLFLLGGCLCWHPWCFPWWANVLFWCAMAASSERPNPVAIVFAVLAAGVAALFLPMFVTPAGHDPGPAFWAWAGSMGILAIGLGVSLVPPPPPLREDEECRDLADVPGPGPPGSEGIRVGSRPPG